MKPFIKWVGGKTQILPTLMEHIQRTECKTYIEPFIGGGSVFLKVLELNLFDRYIINDINKTLIDTYITIRDDIDRLIIGLEKIQNKYNSLSDMNSKRLFYYDIRDKFNTIDNSTLDNSIMFIFLNKTCFNGLYRENSLGEFNTPFGEHSKVILVIEELEKLSSLLNLRNLGGEFIVTVLNGKYTEVESYIDECTFVYMDPPYRPVTTNGFNSYNKSGFNDNDQVRLCEFFKSLSTQHVKLLMSNSDPKVLDQDDNFFDDLYDSFIIQRINAIRSINSDATSRGAITELLIMNY